MLVTVQFPDRPDPAVEHSLDELEHLLRGLAIHARIRIVQKRASATPSYLGEGKLRELARLMSHDGGMVVVDDELTPGQQRSLEHATGAEVLDRTAVILRVFERRARTREARLEVELARLTYELPRIRDDVSLGDREGGGGRASRGNSNVELAKERARARLAELRRELEALQQGAAVRRQRRASTQRVALVGYTNAGKSSLMRALTGTDVLVEDKLFATLGTTVRPVAPATAPPILVADTVGFIERLPQSLMASFRSTFDEAGEAALQLLVVDAADVEHLRHLDVVRRTLADAGADAPQLVVLNKIDRVPDEERRRLAAELPDAIQLSALSASDVAQLRARLIEHFDGRLQTATFELPYDQQSRLAEVRDQVRVLEEAFGDRRTVTLRATPEILDRLRRVELGARAARHGLELDLGTIRLEEAGLDYRVAFARAHDGADWVLRVPRRPDVSAKLSEERRILGFVAPHLADLAVAVPSWEVCSDDLVAYRQLPGTPGLTLDPGGQPVWHFDPSSPEFAAALGRLIAALHAVDVEAARAAGVPVMSPADIRAQWRADYELVRRELAVAPRLQARWEAWLDDDARWPTRAVFTHGELYAAHVLIDTPGHIVGVLDWTTAKVGDPAVDFTYQHMMGRAAFEATVAAYLDAGGVPIPNLAERCADVTAAAPLTYGVFALRSGDAKHLATARALLLPEA